MSITYAVLLTHLLIVCISTPALLLYLWHDRVPVWLAAARGCGRWCECTKKATPEVRKVPYQMQQQGSQASAGGEKSSEEVAHLRRRMQLCGRCYCALKMVFFASSLIATAFWHVQASALGFIGVLQLINFGHSHGNLGTSYQVDMLLWAVAAAATVPWLVFIAIGAWQFDLPELAAHFGMLVVSFKLSPVIRSVKRTLWWHQQCQQAELEGIKSFLCIVCVYARRQ